MLLLTMYIDDLSTEPIKNQAYTTSNYQIAHRIHFNHAAAQRKDPNPLKVKNKKFLTTEVQNDTMLPEFVRG
jgi:hypothetical protein